MRGVVITAIWLGLGFGITEFVASFLETRGEHQAVQKRQDQARDARDLQATGPATPRP